MKHKLLKLKALLVVLMMAVGFGQAFAEDVTYSFTITASDFNTTSYAANNGSHSSTATCTSNPSKTMEVDWTSYQVMKNSSNMQWQKNKGYIYNTTDLGTIVSVEVTSSEGSFTKYYGTTEHPTSGTTVGDGFFTVSVGDAKGITSSIVVTFTVTEEGGGGDTPTTHTLTYSATNGSIGGVVYGTSTPVESGASVAEGGKVTLTATPSDGYEFSSWEVSGTGSTLSSTSTNPTTFTMGTANATVTINFKAIPTYTVTLSDDTENPITENTPGAGVTLPSRSAIGSYTFAGWSETNASEETTTAPTIIPAGNYAPTANITLYPVYTKTIGGGGTSHEKTSVTISEYAGTNAWGSSSSANQKNITLNSDVTAICNSGTHSGKYYSDGWRIYQTESGKVTVSTKSGELTSVTFTFTNSNYGTLNYNSSAITSGTAVDVSGTSAEFTVGNSGSATNGQVRISAISVNYDVTGAGTTYYWSAPVAATVEMPNIVVAENPFFFSTKATITCATEGAAIKYSYDGETWNDYEEPLVITEAKTIYAKAIKDENESSVAQVTATKNLATPTVTINVPDGFTNDLANETEVAAGTLTASVTYNEAAVASASVTWESTNTDVATVNATTGAVTLIAQGMAKIKANYAGNSDYAAANAEYDLTVIDSYEKGQRNNPYTVSEVNSGSYSGNKYVIGYIVGVFNAYDKDALSTGKSNVALSDSPSEIGGAKTIAIQLPSGALRNAWNIDDNAVIGYKIRVYGSIESYFTNKTGVKSTSEITAVAVPAAVSTSSYATFAANAALDFTDSNIKAYIAITKGDGTGVNFTQINKVPANTGVLLYKDGGATEEIPVTTESTDNVANNKFVRGTGGTVATDDGDNYNYILNNGSNGIGFYRANGKKVAANRAYISIPQSESPSPAKDFITMPGFDDDPTGVNDVIGKTEDGRCEIYNLAGQRINKLQKGINIINGKKIMK